mmetsp:Transcript_17016/g.34787  ORF Transcript_17016/g.34787 Transcript_17016/m.34787 type:complete len:439 (-) Transcript_17016:133-1449(-)
MTVVSAQQEMLKIANASESVLSAQEATADFGFAETLGHFNVYFGTDLHRFVLRGRTFASSWDSDSRRASAEASDPLRRAVSDAVGAALPCPPEQCGRVADAMTTFRRIMLHTVVLHLVGDSVLRAYNACGGDFLADFMAYQDRVEDATARGVALPAAISRRFVWRPVRRERERLVRVLGGAISSASVAREGVGVWLEAIQSVDSRSDIPAWRRYVQRRVGPSGAAACDSRISAEEAAELIVGLLFAAHKNPGIGAAQTLLLLLEHPAVLREVLLDLRGSQASGGSALLRRSILETLRITAHTIGGIRKVMEPDGFRFTAADGKAFRVPRGEYVVLSHTLPNNDPAKFANPAEFDPGRFAGPDIDEYTFTTFSQGLHRCPGRNYALRIMEQVLEEMLLRFDFRPASPLPSMSHERATLAQRSGPCPLDYSCASEAPASG